MYFLRTSVAFFSFFNHSHERYTNVWPMPHICLMTNVLRAFDWCPASNLRLPCIHSWKEFYTWLTVMYSHEWSRLAHFLRPSSYLSLICCCCKVDSEFPVSILVQINSLIWNSELWWIRWALMWWIWCCIFLGCYAGVPKKSWVGNALVVGMVVVRLAWCWVAWQSDIMPNSHSVITCMHIHYYYV